MRQPQTDKLLFFALCSFLLVFGSELKASEPSIETRSREFAEVEAHLLAVSQLDRPVARGVANAYRRLISSFQTAVRLRHSCDTDVAMLFDAARKAQSYTGELPYVRDMQLDLRTLQERGKASEEQYIQLNDALITNRIFSEARAVERAHPGQAIQRFHSNHGDVFLKTVMVPAPAVVDETNGRAKPSELLLSGNGKTWRRKNVELRSSANIVVVISPECPFARAGLKKIEADPTLRKLVRNHVIWLVPPYTPEFEAISRWNHAHPHEIMGVAYAVREWPALDRWATPTFYFLKHGTVVKEFTGWPPEGRIHEISAAARQIGLL